jgi:putative membrane protein
LSFIISLLINAVALALAAWLVPGIYVSGETAWETVTVLAVMALIFGLVNALIRPLVRFLTCLINIVTLGLFTLVINAGMLWLSSWIAGQLGVGFHVEGVLAAFVGALLISVVSLVLDLIFGRKGNK